MKEQTKKQTDTKMDKQTKKQIKTLLECRSEVELVRRNMLPIQWMEEQTNRPINKEADKERERNNTKMDKPTKKQTKAYLNYSLKLNMCWN
jgi:hypothetical protein